MTNPNKPSEKAKRRAEALGRQQAMSTGAGGSFDGMQVITFDGVETMQRQRLRLNHHSSDNWYPAGYCYWNMVRVCGHEQAKEDLGAYPSLDVFLQWLESHPECALPMDSEVYFDMVMDGCNVRGFHLHLDRNGNKFSNLLLWPKAYRVLFVGGDNLGKAMVISPLSLNFPQGGPYSPQRVEFSPTRINFAVDDPLANKKVFCNRCLFWVNPEGHATRCKQQAGPIHQIANSWNARRRIAWLNDVVHAIDVKLALILLGTPGEYLGKLFQDHTCADSQQAYWSAMTDTSHLPQPVGTNAHAISTAFECSYSGTFREEYMIKTFGEKTTLVILGWAPYSGIAVGMFSTAFGGTLGSTIRLPITWNRRDALAWYNRSVFEMDVKLALALEALPGPQLDSAYQRHVENTALEAYWNKYEDKSGFVQPSGTSTKSIATAFCANYSASFRSTYLRRTFPSYSDSLLSMWFPFVFD